MRGFVGSVATLVTLAAPALCWGDYGHEITATIAQIHLLPSAREAICRILPGTFKCHLAGVATWPDLIKLDKETRGSSGLHFVNAKGDNPPQKCDFGGKGWMSNQNILQGIIDTTGLIRANDTSKHDRALRFLVHFFGDIHQPFHLTGRDKGGNNVPVSYNKLNTSLHGLWDDFFINHMVLHLPNYTSPLPTTPTSGLPPSELVRNKHIEAALRGSNYDSYIRWILVEGIYQWWASELTSWRICPQQTASQSQTTLSRAPFEDPVDLPVCPFYWASQTHELLCGYIWPADLTSESPRMEMNQGYADRVRDDKIVEKQLALGGIRLAVALNSVLGSDEDKRRHGVLPTLY